MNASLRTALLVVAAAVAAMVVTAPAAAADDTDDAYLKALHSRGLSSGDQAAIDWAHLVCRELSDGTSMNAIIDEVALYQAPRRVPDTAEFMVKAAVVLNTSSETRR